MNYHLFQAQLRLAFKKLLIEVGQKIPQNPKNIYSESYYLGIIDGYDAFGGIFEDVNYEMLIAEYESNITYHKGTLKAYYWAGFVKSFKFNYEWYVRFKKENSTTSKSE